MVISFVNKHYIVFFVLILWAASSLQSQHQYEHFFFRHSGRPLKALGKIDMYRRKDKKLQFLIESFFGIIPSSFNILPQLKTSVLAAQTVAELEVDINNALMCGISNCHVIFYNIWWSKQGKRSILTGKGIGPITVAPVRFAVSIISKTEVSSCLRSYPFS